MAPQKGLMSPKKLKRKKKEVRPHPISWGESRRSWSWERLLLCEKHFIFCHWTHSWGVNVVNNYLHQILRKILWNWEKIGKNIERVVNVSRNWGWEVFLDFSVTTMTKLYPRERISLLSRSLNEFPIIRKVGNVGIFVLVIFENK